MPRHAFSKRKFSFLIVSSAVTWFSSLFSILYKTFCCYWQFPQIVQCFRETLGTRGRQGPFRSCQEAFRFIWLFLLSPNCHWPIWLIFSCSNICICLNKEKIHIWEYLSFYGAWFTPSQCVDVVMTGVSVASGGSVSTMHHSISISESWCIATEAVWFVMDTVQNISGMHHIMMSHWENVINRWVLTFLMCGEALWYVNLLVVKGQYQESLSKALRYIMT